MAKIHLLQAVCAVALFGAVPAFAQTNPASGSHEAMPSDKMAKAEPVKAEPEKADHATAKHEATEHHAVHASKADTSQDAAVDTLNDKSYQAAQGGQAFTGAADAAPVKPAAKKM
jgi:hypothetical protein